MHDNLVDHVRAPDEAPQTALSVDGLLQPIG